MAMSVNYLNGTADAGGNLVGYLGLVDDTGTEISGGGYARQVVSWTDASAGLIHPDADVTFNVPAGATVAGWRGYSESSGGINYGGADLTPQPFSTAGVYNLVAASTAIDHDAGA